MQLDLKYENARQFYIRIPSTELDGRGLPAVFTNIVRRKNNIECQTLELMKRNQKVVASRRWWFFSLILADQRLTPRGCADE